MDGLYPVGSRENAGIIGVTTLPTAGPPRPPEGRGLRPSAQPPEQRLPALLYPTTLLEGYFAGLVAVPPGPEAVSPVDYPDALRGLRADLEARLARPDPGAPRGLLERASRVLEAEAGLRDLLNIYVNLLHKA
jgi:hypothetical protein